MVIPIQNTELEHRYSPAILRKGRISEAVFITENILCNYLILQHNWQNDLPLTRIIFNLAAVIDFFLNADGLLDTASHIELAASNAYIHVEILSICFMTSFLYTPSLPLPHSFTFPRTPSPWHALLNDRFSIQEKPARIFILTG